jgi:hypothetical protein
MYDATKENGTLSYGCLEKLQVMLVKHCKTTLTNARLLKTKDTRVASEKCLFARQLHIAVSYL